jgi:acyl-CoA dehydrogenase
MIFPLGQWRRPPSDHIGHQVASLLLKPGAARDRLTAGMFIPKAHRNAPSPLLNPEETTSHSTKPASGQVAGYLPQAGEEANESLRDSPTYDEQDAVGALEAALASTLVCEPLQAVLEKARKEGRIKAREELQQISEARELGYIDAGQAQQLERDYALRRKVIMVDDFAPETLRANQG